MDMQWLAIFASALAGSVAVVTFWINLGKTAKAAEDAAITVVAVAGKLAILESNFANHRVEVASNYTTNADLKAAIESFTQSIDKLDRRIESYIEFARGKHPHP